MKPAISVIAFASLVLNSVAAENLILNGDFSKGSAKWKGDRKIVYETPAKQNKVCKIEVDEANMHIFYQTIKAEGFKRLNLTYRVKMSENYSSTQLPYGVNLTGDKSKYLVVGHTNKRDLQAGQWIDFEAFIILYPSHEELTEPIAFDSSFGELSFIVQTGYSGYLMFDDILLTGE